MKIKCEGQNKFFTIAPPEYDDIILLKINKIRQEKYIIQIILVYIIKI